MHSYSFIMAWWWLKFRVESICHVTKLFEVVLVRTEKKDQYDKFLIVWILKKNVLIFKIWFAEEGWFTWRFPGFIHLFSEKGSKRKPDTYSIPLHRARFLSIDSIISITTNNQSVFLVRLILNIHAQPTLFWPQCMISLTLSAAIYRNTDQILWLSQPSIWVFFLAFEALSQNGYGKISTTYIFIKYLLLMMEQLISLDRSGTKHLIMRLKLCLELCVFKWLDNAGPVLYM
jgi:hypothetical protein